MLTFDELINEITDIQEAIELVEIKGHTNRENLDFAYNKCCKLLSLISQTVQELQSNQNGSKNQLEEGNLSEKG